VSDTFDEYRAIDAVNISSLLHMARSPLHYRHAVSTPSPDTAATRTGRIVHVAVLEPDRYAAEVAVWRGGRRAGKEWDLWANEHHGRLQLTEADDEQCRAMAASVRRHPIAAGYLAVDRLFGDVLTEHTIKWKASTGTLCKSRLDWADPRAHVIIDLKTTADASSDAFGRSAAKWRYHTRAAFYVDAYQAKYGHAPAFILVAVEKSAPYACAVYRVPPDAIESGRAEYVSLLEQLEHCRASDSWPGLCEDQESTLQLPPWAMGDAFTMLDIDGEVIGV